MLMIYDIKIVEENDKFLLVLDNEVLYVAKTIEEAQGFIDWKNRPDAGN